LGDSEVYASAPIERRLREPWGSDQSYQDLLYCHPFRKTERQGVARHWQYLLRVRVAAVPALQAVTALDQW
jgi:hypothetical protein